MKTFADAKIVRYTRGTSLEIHLDKLLKHIGEMASSE